MTRSSASMVDRRRARSVLCPVFRYRMGYVIVGVASVWLMSAPSVVNVVAAEASTIATPPREAPSSVDIGTASRLLDNVNCSSRHHRGNVDDGDNGFAFQYNFTVQMNTTTAGGTGMRISWSILIPNHDENDDGNNHTNANNTMSSSYIQLALAVPATSGWVAFGIAEGGGMPGADMVVYEEVNNTRVKDCYATDHARPHLDDDDDNCDGDWELLNVTRTTRWGGDDDDDDDFGGELIVHVRRRLDTEDAVHDRPIVYDGDLKVAPHRIVGAWGMSDTMGFHGRNTVTGSIRFFPIQEDGPAGSETDLFADRMEREATGHIDLLMGDYAIPEEVTIYADRCFSLYDLLISVHELSSSNQGQDGTKIAFPPLSHIIGMEPIISSSMPHHLVLYGSTEPRVVSGCTGESSDTAIHGWAVGEGPRLVPMEAGLPLGGELGEGGYISFRLSMHYDNRSLIPNVQDSSGTRLYFTHQLRQHTLGVFYLADPSIHLYGTPVSGDSGIAYHDFLCPSTCLVGLKEPITVVIELFHMHETGARMYNQVLRRADNMGDTAVEDEVVVHQSTIDYWDIHASGLFRVQQSPYTVQAGDAFSTRCYFDESQSTLLSEVSPLSSSVPSVVFGPGSQDEMCIVFLFYYPKQDDLLPDRCGYNDEPLQCDAVHKFQPLEDRTTGFSRTFGQSTQSEVPIEAASTYGCATAIHVILWTFITWIVPILIHV
jgi:dopamine beta-monooxygenase